MDKMNLLVLAIVLLGVFCLGLFLRLFQYKRQLKSFRDRILKRRNKGITSPVEVDIFNREIVELAIALNEYTDEQKELTLQMERDRERLNYVIAGISHDFRTPLTASYGYMQMVKKSGELSEKSLEYLETALEKTRYLKELSDEFFEMSTMEAKLKNLEMEEVRLDKLVQECILGQYEWVERSDLKAEFQIPETSVYVQGNGYYLKRMIENLFSNFRKYAKTYLKVCLEVTEEGVKLIAENDMVSFGSDIQKEVVQGEVLNTITEKTDKEAWCEKVFEPFFRGKARDKEGSGLGLYVVKCLAVAMGYRVWAECEEERFRICLVIPSEKVQEKELVKKLEK